MMYALYKNEFEYGELMDVTMIACADSLEKLADYYEQLEGERAELIFEEADYGYAAQWIVKDSYYRIQELKAL